MADGEIGAVLTAVYLCPVLPLGHIVLVRLTRRETIVVPSLAASCIYVALWAATVFHSVDSGSLSAVATMRMLAAGLCTIGFLAFGYMEAVSHVFRGFTMGILLRVYLNQRLSFQEAMGAHSEGVRADELLEDRIRITMRLNLVQFDGESLTLTPGGRAAGKMGLIVKRMLNMRTGG